MKNSERFSDRVDNYVRYRPHYPAEIIPFLKEQIGLKSGWVIADIGSGTGISSELFLQNGNIVYAVEPNLEMRQAAEAMFKNNKKFISVNASAEDSSLRDGSIDLIIAGQALHWFDPIASKKEFQRIAASDAYLVLMWNDRKLESGFQQAYEQLLHQFAPAYEEVNIRNIDEAAIQAFFAPKPYLIKVFPNAQFFDFEGLKGRLLSSSYAPLEHHVNYQPMINRLEQIFSQYSVNGKVEFTYNCKLYYGKVKEPHG